VKVNGHSSEPKARIRNLQNCFSPLTGEMSPEVTERVKTYKRTDVPAVLKKFQEKIAHRHRLSNKAHLPVHNFSFKIGKKPMTKSIDERPKMWYSIKAKYLFCLEYEYVV